MRKSVIASALLAAAVVPLPTLVSAADAARPLEHTFTSNVGVV